jgi:type III pantothenate kinase
MSVLCIDAGNTRLKWGLRDRGSWVAQGTQLEAVEARPAGILACNVAGDMPRSAIESFSARVGVTVEWLHSSATQCGVTNGYGHPEQLGADRWAALIGARSQHRGDCLVVMSGTATTIDVLTADGRFLGGLILPGLAMMRDALAGGTANLPTAAGEFAEQPRNTFDAITSGALQATAGAIERMFRQIENGADPICLLSGGAALQVAGVSPRLTLPHRLIDNLVLEGLAAIAEPNFHA